MGWMMQVAAMPLRPPFTNGFAVFQMGLSAIVAVCGQQNQHVLIRRPAGLRVLPSLLPGAIGCSA
jgi:hypothetical protein